MHLAFVAYLWGIETDNPADKNHGGITCS